VDAVSFSPLAIVCRLTAETILSVAYGIQIQKENDPYIKISEDANQGAIIAAVPGRFLVDTIPVLKYVPAWIPGASFQRKAREWYRMTRMMVEVPYADAKGRIVSIADLFLLTHAYNHLWLGIRESYCFDSTAKPTGN
jgi:hypothetical protein